MRISRLFNKIIPIFVLGFLAFSAVFTPLASADTPGAGFEVGDDCGFLYGNSETYNGGQVLFDTIANKKQACVNENGYFYESASQESTGYHSLWGEMDFAWASKNVNGWDTSNNPVVDLTTGYISGYAQWTDSSLKNTEKWIWLDWECKDTGAGDPCSEETYGTYRMQVDLDTGLVSGYAWSDYVYNQTGNGFISFEGGAVYANADDEGRLVASLASDTLALSTSVDVTGSAGTSVSTSAGSAPTVDSGTTVTTPNTQNTGGGSTGQTGGGSGDYTGDDSIHLEIPPRQIVIHVDVISDPKYDNILTCPTDDPCLTPGQVDLESAPLSDGFDPWRVRVQARDTLTGYLNWDEFVVSNLNVYETSDSFIYEDQVTNEGDNGLGKNSGGTSAVDIGSYNAAVSGCDDPTDTSMTVCPMYEYDKSESYNTFIVSAGPTLLGVDIDSDNEVEYDTDRDGCKWTYEDQWNTYDGATRPDCDGVDYNLADVFYAREDARNYEEIETIGFTLAFADTTIDYDVQYDTDGSGSDFSCSVKSGVTTCLYTPAPEEAQLNWAPRFRNQKFATVIDGVERLQLSSDESKDDVTLVTESTVAEPSDWYISAGYDPANSTTLNVYYQMYNEDTQTNAYYYLIDDNGDGVPNATTRHDYVSYASDTYTPYGASGGTEYNIGYALRNDCSDSGAKSTPFADPYANASLYALTQNIASPSFSFIPRASAFAYLENCICAEETVALHFDEQSSLEKAFGFAITPVAEAFTLIENVVDCSPNPKIEQWVCDDITEYVFSDPACYFTGYLPILDPHVDPPDDMLVIGAINSTLNENDFYDSEDTNNSIQGSLSAITQRNSLKSIEARYTQGVTGGGGRSDLSSPTSGNTITSLLNDRLLYAEETVYIGGEVSSPISMVVSGANVCITENITGAEFGLMVFKEGDEGGTIYVSNEVTDLHAYMFADGPLLPYDSAVGCPETGSVSYDLDFYQDSFRNQLYIYGGLSSRNTTGEYDNDDGSGNCPIGDGTSLPCDEAYYYDLNLQRADALCYDINSSGIDYSSTPSECGLGESLSSYRDGDGNPVYVPLIIEHNPVSTNLPILFEGVGSVN